jgi:glycyl-tRNA synthetase
MTSLQTLTSFCKRKGFVYLSSDLYGGFSAVYDYGPYGTELLKNIKESWWNYMIQKRKDIIGLDSAIMMSPDIWHASGHVSNFSDPLTECKSCHKRFRVDHMLEEIGVTADEKMSEEEINHIFDEHREKLSCQECGEKDFSEVTLFNLLVKSNLGSATNDVLKNPTYLRGETCQGIYVNYKNILDSTRMSIPFGIGQIGKAFRNEITARQFIFRTREFEQMEMQYFLHPDNVKEEYEKLKEYRMEYYNKLGIPKNKLRYTQHENLVFYASDAYDIEYEFPFGWGELEGIHARGNYDLTQHMEHSKQDLHYTNPQNNQEKYIPHIIESSVGVGRIALAILSMSYTEEKIDEENTRIVMKIPAYLAPIKIAILPLLKNKPELVSYAENILQILQEKYMCEYDEKGSIGKRYRRQDEIGTPYALTIDFDTLENDTMTIRNRDTMKQVQIHKDELLSYFNPLFTF